MKPTITEIRNEIARLREFIDTSDDKVATRVAYEVEQALRWSIEDTEDWPKPLDSLFETVSLLKEGK